MPSNDKGEKYIIKTENQSGGQNIGKQVNQYVTQSPEPRLEASVVESNLPDDGLFRTTFRLSLSDPYAAPRLHVEAHAPSVLSAQLQGGVMMMYMEGTGEGMAFASVGNPGPSYDLIVKSSKPEQIRLTYNFQGFDLG